MKVLFARIFSLILPSKTVLAHCDVPCGIYDPKTAQIAAATVLKMVTLIDDIPQGSTSVEDRNKFVRCVWTKEEHARKCKEEILILWTDYFKPEHIEKFPNLHDVVWKATKLCSQNKQHVSKEMAQQLVDAVNEIADIFNQTKAAK
ncbi:MAG TPA: superoxide dismutase, Ni [Patescibacteria group bacterium]